MLVGDVAPVPIPNARNVMDGLDLLGFLKDGSVATVFFDPQYQFPCR